MSAALPVLLAAAVLHVPQPGEWAQAPAARHPQNGRSCATIGQLRTCTTYARGRAVRVCERRARGREICVRLASAAQAFAAEGWAPGPSPMGRLWVGARGRCTGTLVAAGYVLTAAHCLWEGNGYLSDTAAMTFVPGNAFAGNGIAGEAATAVSPYGAWLVDRSYVPTCWTGGHVPACDVGFARLRPRGGRRAGDVAGTYATAVGACCGPADDVIAGGYPGSGPLFGSYAGSYGNAPYFCGGRPAPGSRLRGCAMTGGASGGPVWSGDRVVGIVTRRAAPATGVVFQPLGDVFAGFACRVLQCPGRDSNPHAP